MKLLRLIVVICCKIAGPQVEVKVFFSCSESRVGAGGGESV